MEAGYKRLEKINDELGIKLAKWHNEKIGFTAAPTQIDAGELVTLMRKIGLSYALYTKVVRAKEKAGSHYYDAIDTCIESFMEDSYGAEWFTDEKINDVISDLRAHLEKLKGGV